MRVKVENPSKSKPTRSKKVAKKTTKKRASKKAPSKKAPRKRNPSSSKKTPAKKRRPSKKKNPPMHPSLKAGLAAVGGGGVTGGGSAALRHFAVGSPAMRGGIMLGAGIVLTPVMALLDPTLAAGVGAPLVALGTDQLTTALLAGKDDESTEGVGAPMTQADLQATARAQPHQLNAVTYDNMAAVTYDDMGNVVRAQPELLGAVIDPSTGLMYDSRGRLIQAN